MCGCSEDMRIISLCRRVVQFCGAFAHQLVNGASGARFLREGIPVRASRHATGRLSTAADEAALVASLMNLRVPTARAFVAQSESGAAAVFAALVRETLHWPSVEVPYRGDRVRQA